MVGNVDGEKKT